MIKNFAQVLTILAGTHMAQAIMPSTSIEDQPRPIPIQWGGYGYGYGYNYDRPSPYRQGPGGYYEPNYGPRYYGGRVVPPEGEYLMRRWRWESDQGGRYSNPPWAGRGW